MRQVLYIGRVAQDPGLSVHAIRFHEREGLLRRLFATKGAFESSVTRRSVISSLFANAQAACFSLAEIPELLVLRREPASLCAHPRLARKCPEAGERHGW